MAPALWECLRCLRSGGTFQIVEFRGKARTVRLFGRIKRLEGRSCRFWTAERLMEMLRGLGLGLDPQVVALDGLRFAVRARKP